MKQLRLLLIFVALVSFTQSCKEDIQSCDDMIDLLRINQVQVVGSHNSYRLKTVEPILQFMYANPQMLPEGFNPDDWDYEHLPLDRQFNEYGIRSIELDVFNDPNGGLFYNRMGLAVLGMSPESGEPALQQPGLKVMHFPDLDFMTNYLTFKDALEDVKAWSDAHPDHVPLIIQIEPKEDNPFALLGAPFTATLPFDKARLETIDAEIKSVFGIDLPTVFTPDELRGPYSTVNKAVLENNWPKLSQARGQIIFVMDGSGNETADYLDGHANLEGRTMFVYANEDDPETAFIKFEDPRGIVPEIQRLVDLGYMIRTRADADTKEARSGDTARRDAAFNSGAQIVSTDYYRPDPRGNTTAGWTNYWVKLPDATIARPNPVNAPADQWVCGVYE